ncbi:hypothetical protein ACQ86N_34560 [Puia sp. P3]|uniref:hypothetical protein n=1 Tax=Puia sp. P3 TaxID=3423952 RepID=UPI003D6760B2
MLAKRFSKDRSQIAHIGIGNRAGQLESDHDEPVGQLCKGAKPVISAKYRSKMIRVETPVGITVFSDTECCKSEHQGVEVFLQIGVNQLVREMVLVSRGDVGSKLPTNVQKLFSGRMAGAC